MTATTKSPFDAFGDDPLGEALDSAANGNEPKPAKQLPANYKPDFVETCPKCRGTGSFIAYSGRVLGPCFACKGKGKNQFKSSPEAREKAKAQRQDRAARNREDNVELFKTHHPAEAAWLIDTANRWELAASLLEGLRKYGSLTEKQMAVIHKGMARDAAKAEAKVVRLASAPTVETAGIDRLKAAFDAAAAYTASKAKGLKVRDPKITIGGMTISPAKAHSKNPGALYVKGKGTERDYQSGKFEQVYLGKIADGKFFASRDCTDEQKAQVLKFVAEPAEAAKVYGQETGTCCICNATLRSEWRLRGIGPICAGSSAGNEEKSK